VNATANQRIKILRSILTALRAPNAIHSGLNPEQRRDGVREDHHGHLYASMFGFRRIIAGHSGRASTVFLSLLRLGNSDRLAKER